MKNKFLIGELARLFNISPDTLRHYDRLDLLKPEVDPKTHYRFYETQSVFKLSRILFLKNLGISLKEIHQYMQNKNRINFQNLLKKKEREVDEKIQQLQNLKHKIQSKIDLLSHYDSELNTIVLRKFPKRYGLFLETSNIIDEKKMKAQFIESENYFKISSLLVEGQMYTSLKKEDMDLGHFTRFRYFIEIECYDDKYHQLETIPENEFACLIVTGPYTEMKHHYEKMVKWIDANDYMIIGDSIEKNIIDYGTTDYETEYVSEIQIPIRSKP